MNKERLVRPGMVAAELANILSRMANDVLSADVEAGLLVKVNGASGRSDGNSKYLYASPDIQKVRGALRIAAAALADAASAVAQARPGTKT